MTLPIKLTLSRLILTFLVAAFILMPGLIPKIAALIGFLLAALTDWLDGYLARRRRQVSALGALLDPVADKVLVLGVLLALLQVGMAPAWMVLLIALRELTVTGVRLMAAGRHVILPAAHEGKQKTVSQIVTILVILWALILREVPPSAGAVAAGWRAAVNGVALACLWITVVLTLSSGASFFWRHRGVLKDIVAG